MNARLPLATAVTALMLAARPAQAADAPPTDPIIGGVQTEEGRFDAVVALRNSRGALCTGTLITTRIVMTAAHCLDEQREGSPVRVFFGPDTDGLSMESVSFGIHPDYCEFCDTEVFDFAYIELPEPYLPVDGVLPPITDQFEWNEAMRPTRKVFLVGYGTNNPSTSSGLRDEVKRDVSTTIARFSENALEFFAGGGQRDTCNGDSGGPAVVQLGSGQYRLGGVTSRGLKPCGQGGWYGVPYTVLTWLRDETGADLLPPDCPFGDCLDLLPPGEQEGCSVASPGPTAPAVPLLLVLLAARRRRRLTGFGPAGPASPR
ncbi:MAG: trypsin-like serine protease [Nannocystaceae bacterium]